MAGEGHESPGAPLYALAFAFLASAPWLSAAGAGLLSYPISLEVGATPRAAVLEGL